MIFFVIFVFSAVILGIGVMLSPILPTTQPRIGLASTIALASTLIIGILWTTLVMWDALIIDYVLFGFVSVVILGGTMIQAHEQSDADETESSTQWMSRNDFLFFLIIGGICISLSIFNLQADQQIDIISALQAGQSVEAMTQEFPQLTHFSMFGFHILSTYLSQQLQQESAIVQSAVATVLLFLCVLASYDFGAEIKDTWLGRFLAVIALVFLIILSLYSQAILLAILIFISILIFALRFYRHRHWLDFLGLSVLVTALVLI